MMTSFSFLEEFMVLCFLNAYLILNRFSLFLNRCSFVIRGICRKIMTLISKFIISFSVMFIKSLLKTFPPFKLLFLEFFLDNFFSDIFNILLSTWIIKKKLSVSCHQKSVIKFFILFTSLLG